MRTSQPLSSLREGQTARVLSVERAGGLSRRLLDLGLIAGTPVRCIQKSPAGDPVAYGIRGAVIALRREQADAVLVQQ